MWWDINKTGFLFEQYEIFMNMKLFYTRMHFPDCSSAYVCVFAAHLWTLGALREPIAICKPRPMHVKHDVCTFFITPTTGASIFFLLGVSRRLLFPGGWRRLDTPWIHLRVLYLVTEAFYVFHLERFCCGCSSFGELCERLSMLAFNRGKFNKDKCACSHQKRIFWACAKVCSTYLILEHLLVDGLCRCCRYCCNPRLIYGGLVISDPSKCAASDFDNICIRLGHGTGPIVSKSNWHMLTAWCETTETVYTHYLSYRHTQISHLIS